MPLAWLQGGSRLLLAQQLLVAVSANMYDVLEPAKLHPQNCVRGCARWGQLVADGASLAGSPVRNQSAANALWAGGAPPEGYAGCAQPGSAMGTPLPDDPNSNVGWGGWMGRDGSWCWCKHGPSPASVLINVTVLESCDAASPAQQWSVGEPAGAAPGASGAAGATGVLVRHRSSGLCLSFQGPGGYYHGQQDVGLKKCR
jgi:hypothetical protein